MTLRRRGLAGRPNPMTFQNWRQYPTPRMTLRSRSENTPWCEHCKRRGGDSSGSRVPCSATVEPLGPLPLVARFSRVWPRKINSFLYKFGGPGCPRRRAVHRHCSWVPGRSASSSRQDPRQSRCVGSAARGGRSSAVSLPEASVSGAGQAEVAVAPPPAEPRITELRWHPGGRGATGLGAASGGGKHSEPPVAHVLYFFSDLLTAGARSFAPARLDSRGP